MKNFLKLSNNFFIILFCFSNAQDKMDKAIYPCGYGLSANRWLGTESSLTENQSKIDVTFYRIKLEIDIDEKEIIGSVLVNGLIGMDQPDSIEFDLAQGMTVDSVKLYNELHSFVHTDNLVKIPRPDVTVPEGYEFSVEVFYHGNPEPTGFGSFNFDTHSGIDHIWTLSEPYGARDWWPCKDDPSDKADSAEIIVIVPEEQVVVSNGLLIDEIELNNGTIVQGSILQEDMDRVILKTQIGQIRIEKSDIISIKEIAPNSPNLIFETEPEQKIYDDKRVFSGTILNDGMRRSDFTRVIFYLWDEDTNLIASDSSFVDGSVTQYSSGIITDSAIESGEYGSYQVSVAVIDIFPLLCSN